MPSTRDWRDPAPYEQAETYPARNLAWEFLRRNPDYRRAYRATARQPQAIADDAVGRWGLRFRG